MQEITEPENEFENTYVMQSTAHTWYALQQRKRLHNRGDNSKPLL